MAKIVIVPFPKTKLKIQLSPKLTKNHFSYEDVILDQSIWLRETLLNILESVNAGKLPNFDFDDDRIPYWGFT